MLDRKDNAHRNRTNPTFVKRGLGGAVRGDIGGDIRGRGSLLILVVTVLVIIALVGIAFLQRVRLDQAATARHERSYIDLVINGILAEIGGQMTEDIFENANNGRELYDYPWTRDNVQEVDAFFIDGTKVPGRVNGSGKDDGTGTWVSTHEDDRWLASSAPILSPANTYNWLHLSNLTGIWLDLEANNPEQPIDGLSGNIARSDTDIRLSVLGNIPTGRIEPLGVDADGDGIYDSRWQWTPLSVRDIAGRKFVMAVRIVDLNSMLNVNTATSLTAVGGQNDPEISGGYNPAWADLSRLLSRSVNSAGNANPWRGELATMLNFRINQVRVNPFPDAMDFLSTAKELQTIWEKQASIYGNLDRNYLSDSEVELRRFGGINDLSIESPLEQKMPRLLRQSPAPTQAEGSYVDVVGGAGSTEAQISRWFYGADPSNPNEPDTNSVPVKDREFQAIRHMLTAASGVGAYVTNHGGKGIIRKYDLRHELNDAQKLRDRIEQAFKPPSATPAQWYLGNNISLPETMDDLVNEYAMAIEDYADEDSIPGGFNRGELNGAGVAYGLERLPFLREAYFQMLYAYSGDERDGATNAAGNDTIADTWVGLNGTEAVVLELGNPFPHEMLSSELNGRIRIVIEQSGAIVGTPWVYNNPAATTMGARDNTTMDDTLIVISDPTDTTQNDQSLGDDPESDLNLTGTNNVKTPAGQLSFIANSAQISVLLQVNINPNPSTPNWVTYDRMDTDAEFDAQITSDPAPTVTLPSTPLQHAQRSFWRNSDEINYISVDTGDGSAKYDPPDPTVTPGTFDQALHNFQTDSKPAGSGAWTMPTGFQLALSNQPIRSIAELAWIHMFGFTDTEPFSERVGRVGLAQPSRHFLLLDPADPDYRVLNTPTDPVSPGAGVPHAAVLMDVFTTVGTHEDGLDNDNKDGDEIIDQETSSDTSADGRSIDNTTEQFIPGMINVNTAPLHILTLGSPLAGGIDDTEALMRLIINYRDQPTKFAASYPATPDFDPNLRTNINTFNGLNRVSKPGIATIGELMFMDLNNADEPFNMQRYANDADPALPVELDLYPDPDEAGASSVNQGEDNEQRLARFQFLSQTLTTRSDRFAVYVVIRGYDWDAQPGTPISGSPLSETAQFIAIFDRGSMVDKNDLPRVIGFVRLQ